MTTLRNVRALTRYMAWAKDLPLHLDRESTD
jgi:hypothetical protein